MAEESIFLEHLGNNPRMRVLDYLIGGRDFDYTLTDMLNAGVSWVTLNSLVPNLMKLGIIIKTRKIGRATLYKLNKDNVIIKKLIEVDNILISNELKKRVEEQKTKATK